MTIVTFLLSAVVFALAVVFAVSNRATVSLSLWPFDVVIEAPLYLLLIGTLTAGVLLGGAAVWLTVLPHRLLARRLARDVETLGTKLDTLQADLRREREGVALPPPRKFASVWQFWKR